MGPLRRHQHLHENTESAMMNDAVKEAALADRKAKLLLDGAVYRVGIVHAKATVAHGLRAESLMQSAVENTIGFAGVQLKAVLAPTGSRFAALMPLAVAAFSYLSRKKLLKPAIGAGLVVAAAVAVAGQRSRSSGR
jgi:hypothetical protein